MGSLSLWVEKVQKNRFQVCVREDDGHDDKHLASVYVDWIVVAKRFTNQRICEDAGTCANGVLIPRWQDRLQKNHCGSCDEGYWLNPMTRSCDNCPAGHYCTNSIKTACGADNEYSASGAVTCKTCKPGSFTSGGDRDQRTTCAKCPAGSLCNGSSTKKPAAKKPAAKKPAAKKPAAKQPVAKKPAAKKPVAKKPAAKKPAAKKPTAKQPAAKQPAAKKPTAKQPA